MHVHTKPVDVVAELRGRLLLKLPDPLLFHPSDLLALPDSSLLFINLSLLFSFESFLPLDFVFPDSLFHFLLISKLLSVGLLFLQLLLMFKLASNFHFPPQLWVLVLFYIRRHELGLCWLF